MLKSYTPRFTQSSSHPKVLQVLQDQYQRYLRHKKAAILLHTTKAFFSQDFSSVSQTVIVLTNEGSWFEYFTI